MMNQQSSFTFKAIEIHDRVWDKTAILKALSFAKRNGMNALVLHSNDIVDEVVWPAKYYGATKEGANLYENYNEIHNTVYKRSARRRYMPIHRRDFLQWVIRTAKRDGIQVYLENKELWFPDYLVEIFPELRKNGNMCCCDPIWWQFIETKYKELTADLPGLAGIITSPGSRESRLTISGNRCTCKYCQTMTKSDWYFRLIMSMYEPLHQAGQTLIVRDFVFDKANQQSLASAMDLLPDDVILSLKNTPHDFYPTFPNNPKIGQTGHHRVWIEFDAMGQYYGWGIGMACMAGDMRERLNYALQHAACGVMVRTDWEGLPGHSCFDTPNLVNLYAAAVFADNPSAKIEDVYRRWLIGENMLKPAADVDACAVWMAELLEATWDSVRRANYMNDCVFCDSSCFPVGLDHAFWLGEEKNSLRDWLPEKHDALEPTEPNISLILAEKEEAVERSLHLEAALLKGNHGLTDEAYEDLKFRFRISRLYTEGFSLIGQAAILGRAVIRGKADGERVAQLHERLGSLLQFAGELERLAEQENWPFVVQAALNPERIHVFYQDVIHRVTKL